MKLYFYLLLLLLTISSNVIIAQTLVSASGSNSYCTGGAGVAFRINNSVANTTYQLQRSSGTWTTVSTVTATSTTTNFPGNWTAGTYRLSSAPVNTITITTITVTNTFKVTGSGGYCAGGDGLQVGLSGSQTGVTYELFVDGATTSVTLPGSSGALSFGIFKKGVYTVRATNGGCTIPMTSTATITENSVPSVTFTHDQKPAPDCGTVDFNSTPVGNGPFTYLWSFNPGSSIHEDTSFKFNAYGTGTQQVPVSLKITDKNGCNVTLSQDITVTQSPDATVDKKTFWNNCNSATDAAFALTIINKSQTASTNTSYIINWNDPLQPGTVTYTPAQFPINGELSHTYTSKGSFQLTVTAIGPSSPGCSDTKIFPIFNGSSPTGGISYEQGILNGCAPHTITFKLAGAAKDNAPTTQYYFDFGDGTDPLIFYQENMPELNADGTYHITHTYEKESCSSPGMSFMLQHQIQNPCQPAVYQPLGGITISKQPASDFLRDEFPTDPILVCAGEARVFTNQSTTGCLIANGEPITVNGYHWDINNDGTYESASENPSFTFSTPGEYQVRLQAITGESITPNCGGNESIRTICVQAAPVAEFTLSPEACLDAPITPVNTSVSDPKNCADPQYLWTVTPNTGFTYSGNTSSSSFEPDFNFTEAGDYIIKLDVTVNTGTTPCSTDSYELPIKIKSPPAITVKQPPTMPQCGPGGVDLSTVVTYNANQGTISKYEWAISPTGATISDASAANPVITIVDNVSRVYTLNVSATNECGTTKSTDITITVTQGIANNTINYTGINDLCTGMVLANDIIGSLPTGGNGTSLVYSWYISDGTTPILIDGANSQNLKYTSQLTTNPVEFKRRVTSGSCVSESDPIIFNVVPGVQQNDIGQPQSICSGATPATIVGTTPTQGTGTFVYLWQQSTDAPNFTTWIDATGTNNQKDYSPGNLSVTTRYRRNVKSGVCDVSSNEIEITVNPIPVINSSSTVTVCSGIDLNYEITSTAPETTYTWVVTDLSSGNISGANNYTTGSLTSIHDVLTNTSSTSQTIRYTITPTGKTPTSCPGAPFDLTVTVKPKFNSTYSNKSINNGTSTTLTGTISGGDGGYSYSWAPTDKLAVNQSTLPEPLTILLTATTAYTLTVTDASLCQFTQVVTVTTTGTGLDVVITSSDLDGTICEGDPITLTATASGGGGSGTYSYTWSGLPVGTNYISQSVVQFSPDSLGVNTKCVIAKDGFSEAKACIAVTVDQIPSVSSALLKQICSGEDVDYTPEADVPGTTFSWSRVTNPNITSNPSATNGINTITNILTNSNTEIEIVNYTIKPTGPAPTYCVGPLVTLEVRVMPSASITNAVNSQTVVSGSSSAPVTFTSDVTTAGIHWKYLSTSSPCAGLVSFTAYEGYTETLPAQTISLAPGTPASCILSYDVRPYQLITVGDTCWGNPYTYNFTINNEPSKYVMLCPTSICTGQTATVSLSSSDVGINYKLYRGTTYVDNSELPGTGAQLDWADLNIAGAYSIRATNPTNGQTTTMDGLCQVIINPLPQIFLLTALNGEHCSPVTLELSGSEAGINYYLIRNGDVNNPVQIIAGTGSAGFLVFDPVNDLGEYTVNASNPLTNCNRTMQGSIHIDALIKQFPSYPGGIICAGENLCLDGSEPGIEYQLWLNDQPYGAVVNGDLNGGSVCFGSISNAGTYRIRAKNPVTECEIFFDEPVVINPLPISYTVSPVQGCAGSEIMLNDCQAGVEYFLYFTPTAKKSPMSSIVAGPFSCTGGAISFGKWYDEGIYEIQAVDAATDCFSWMTGTATIYPEPEVYDLVPQGPACPPTTISLENFQMKATYYLYRNGAELVAQDDGANGSIDFGIQTVPGNYTVRAQFTFAGGHECWKDMKGSVDIYPEPVKYSLLPLGPLCPPVAFSLNGSESGVTYSLWNDTYGTKQVITGDGKVLAFLPENEPGQYWVVAETANNCESIMYNKISILPSPKEFNITPPGQGLCESTLIGLDDSEPNTTYELLRADGSSLIPKELYTPAVAGSFLFNNPHPAGSYIVKATNANNCETLMKGTAIVNPLPNVDAGPPLVTLCSPPSVSILLNGNASNYSGLRWTSPTNPDGSNFSSPGTATTMYTFTANDLLNKEVVLTLTATGTGICAGEQVKDEITIHLLAPIVDPGADQTVCANEKVQLTGAISGGATEGIWTTSGAGTFDHATWLNAIYTPDPADQTAGSVTLTLTTTNSGLCPNLGEHMSVTFYDQLTPGIAGSNQTLCYGETPATIAATEPTGGSANFEYQWQFSEDDGSSWLNVASDGNTLSYNPSALTVTTWFKLQQMDTYCNPDQTVTTNTVLITVYPQLTPGTATDDQTICYGETPATLTATEPTGGSGNIQYQWQLSTNNGTSWANVATGGTALTYSPPALNITTSFRLLQTDTYCTPDQAVTTNTVTITVHSQLTSGTVSTDQTICYGETPAPLTATEPLGGSGSFQYQWQFSTNGGNSWADVAPDGTSLTYSPPVLSITTSYKLLQTDTYCNPDQAVTTNTVTITVHSQLTAGTVTADQTICYGETPATLTATEPGGGSKNFGYQWQYSTNGGTTWTNVQTNGTSLSYSPPSLNTTTAYQLLITDSYCTPDQGVTTNTVTITVYPQLTAGTATADQTICYGETPASLTATEPGGGSKNFGYQWQYSINGGTTWTNVPTNGTSLSYSPPSLNVTTAYQLLQTDSYCTPDQSVTTNTVTITVYPQLTAGTATSDQTICYGETPVMLTAIAPKGGSGSYQYQWQLSTNAGLTWTDVALGGNTLSYSPASLTATTLYKLRQNDIYCNSNQLVFTNQVIITVYENLTAGNAGSDQTICYGDTPGMIAANAPTGGSGTFQYQWQLSNDAGLKWSDIDLGGSALTFSPGALTNTTLYRQRQTDEYCNPDQLTYTNNVAIIVRDVLTPGKAGSDQTICYGEIPEMIMANAPTGGGGTFQYQWQFSINEGLSWSDVTTAGNSLNYSPGPLFITTLFKLKQTDPLCNPDQVVFTNAVTIEVPVPISFAGPNGVACGLVPYTLSQAAAKFAVSYSWSTSGTGSFTEQFALNATYFPTPADMKAGHVVLTLTIKDNCGAVVSDDMTLTLSQLPVAYYSYSTPTCANSPVYFGDQSEVSNGVLNNWIWDFGDGTADTIYFPDPPDAKHTFTEPGITYNVKLKVITELGCSAEYQQAITTLHSAAANFATDVSCDNQPVLFTNKTELNGSIGLQSYRWNFGDPASGISNTSDIESPGHLFSKAGTFSVTLTVNNNNNCLNAITKDVTIRTHPPVDFTYSSSCLNASIIFSPDEAITAVDSIVTWRWDFDDGIKSGEQNALHVFILPGIYTVSLTVTDVNGCEGTISHTVTINPLPSVRFDAGRNNCAASTVNFTELSTTTTGYVNQWHWDFGDGTEQIVTLPGNPNVTHVYEAAANYQVTLSVQTSQGCSNSITLPILINPKPITNFDYTFACDSLPVHFTDLSQSNGGGNVEKWQWNFGDQSTGIKNTSQEPSPDHTFSAPNTYTVQLIATTANGCSESTSRQITVKSKPPVGFTTQNICEGAGTIFKPDTALMSINSIASWFWTFGEGTTSDKPSPTRTFLKADTYSVTLTVTDQEGCINSITRRVTIQPRPVASFTNSNICMNSPVSFTSLSLPTGIEPITKWHWDFGVTGILNDTSNSSGTEWTYTSPGVYLAALKVTTLSGCSDSVAMELQVLSQPNADFTFSGSACSKGNITFTDASNSEQTTIDERLWEFLPGIYSTVKNPVYGFPETVACYPVKLTITDNKGCQDTVSKQVCVSPLLVADFTYTPTCLGDTTTFAILAPATELLQSSTWNFGDPFAGSQNNTSLEKNPKHYYNLPGTYTVILQAYDINHCKAEKFLVIEVKPLPDPSFSYTSGACDSTVYFTGHQTSGGSNILSWQWDFGDGTTSTIEASTESTVSHRYLMSGNYFPSLTITNQANCSNTYTESILVKPCIQADFALSSLPVCQNNEISFTDNSYSAMPITEWKWYFGDTTAPQTYYQKKDIINHSFVHPGSHLVKLVVKTSIGNVEVIDSTSLTVLVQPTPTANFTTNSVCLGDSVNFNNTSEAFGSSLSSISWIFDDPKSKNNTSSAYNTAHLYSSEGDYLPKLVIKNSDGCMDSVDYNLSIYSPPQAALSVQNPCISQPTRFADVSIPGSGTISQWNWSVTDDKGYWQIDKTQNPSIVFESAGDYLAKLTVTDNFGCKDSVSQKITEKQSPVSGFSFVEKTDPANELWQIAVTNESKGAALYYWDFDNGKYSMEENPVTSFDEERLYTIQLVSQNSDLCTDTITKPFNLIFRGLYIPTAFLPQDPTGVLNVFQPKGEGLEAFDIEVYDRWGALMWASNSEKLVDGHPGPGWDGKYQGVYVPIGIYTWKAAAVFKDGSVWNGNSMGENKRLSGAIRGTVTIIR